MRCITRTALWEMRGVLTMLDNACSLARRLKQRCVGAAAEAAEGHQVAALAGELRTRVLYRDEELLVLDKPAGLAVQGGHNIDVSLDAALPLLRFGVPETPRRAASRSDDGAYQVVSDSGLARASGALMAVLPSWHWLHPGGCGAAAAHALARPMRSPDKSIGGRLVHRLDRDVSGAIVVARTPDAAAWLSAALARPALRLQGDDAARSDQQGATEARARADLSDESMLSGLL